MRLGSRAVWPLAAAAALALSTSAAAAGPARAPTTKVSVGPSWMAHTGAAAGAPLVYVATNGCGCVTVYNQKTLTQVGQITGLNEPSGIAVGPDGTLWVGLFGAVEAFAPGTTTPSLTIPLKAQDFAMDVAVSPDGHVYVPIATYGQGNAIDVFAPGATKPMQTIDLKAAFGGGNVAGIGLDKAGNIYLSGTQGIDQGRLAEIAAGTSKIVVLPPILAYPQGVIIDGSGNLLVGDFENATTYVLRPGAAQPLRNIGTVRSSDPVFLAFDQARTTLYVGDALHAVVDIYDVATRALKGTLPAAGGNGTYVGVATSPRAQP